MTRIIVQERDRIPSRKMLAIGIGSIVVFAVGVLLSSWILHSRTLRLLPHGPGPLPDRVGQAEIGIVDQYLFEVPSNFMDRQRLRLDSYGWIDRPRGQVHIPVERAMQLVLEEAKR